MRAVSERTSAVTRHRRRVRLLLPKSQRESVADHRASPVGPRNLRSRYGQAGNKYDRFDAFVLADTLRTDRSRLRGLTPDTEATVALRAAVRARKDLVHHRVALANQLRALAAFLAGIRC